MLTKRELEIVEGVMRGRSNDEIAAELGLARKTVEAHLTRLFGRFQITTRTELALKADREGWLAVAPKHRPPNSPSR
jgi:two-component system competent response regulator ComA